MKINILALSIALSVAGCAERVQVNTHAFDDVAGLPGGKRNAIALDTDGAACRVYVNSIAPADPQAMYVDCMRAKQWSLAKTETKIEKRGVGL